MRPDLSALTCRLAQDAWKTWTAPAARRFERALGDPEEAQWKVLRRLLRRGARSAYGRHHGFASVRSVAEYQERVPLVSYDDLVPWIDRIRGGERGVLTTEPVLRLVPSSGSTAARKLIPWTRGVAAAWGRAIHPWTHDLFEHHPASRGGPAYWSVSPALGADAAPPSAVPVGFDEDSAYLGGVLGPLVRTTLAVPEEIRHVEETETFRYLTALGLLRSGGLRLISVWHPSFFALILDAMERHWTALLRDVARGTVTPPSVVSNLPAGAGPAAPIPPALRAALGAWRRPEPARARTLERATGAADVGALWPRLAVLSCWADGSSAGPAEALRRRLAGVTLQPKGLLATEGAVTVPFAGSRPVAVRSHFLEFLDERGRARTVQDLEQDATYGLVLTTQGGLYRYRLGDRVRVEGFIERTPCLGFVGKEDGVSDLCGEKLDGAFVADVLHRLFPAGPPTFLLLAPDTAAGSAGYTLYLDGLAPAPDHLARRLDTALSANPHYRYARRLGQLRPPAVFRIEADAHAAYLEREAGAGRRLGDVKAVALSNRADWSAHFRGGYVSGTPVDVRPEVRQAGAVVARPPAFDHPPRDEGGTMSFRRR